jgi:hypothetical protein
MRSAVLTAAATGLILAACQQSEPPAPATAQEAAPEPAAVQETPAEQPSRYDIYAEVRLSADLSHLDDNQKQMIPLLIEASKIMDHGTGWQPTSRSSRATAPSRRAPGSIPRT